MLANPCKSFENLVLKSAPDPCLPGCPLQINPWKSLQIFTNPRKSLQILNKSLQFFRNPNKSLEILVDASQSLEILQIRAKNCICISHGRAGIVAASYQLTSMGCSYKLKLYFRYPRRRNYGVRIPQKPYVHNLSPNHMLDISSNGTTECKSSETICKQVKDCKL